MIGLFASIIFLAMALGIARWATRRPSRDNQSRWRQADELDADGRPVRKRDDA